MHLTLVMIVAVSVMILILLGTLVAWLSHRR